MAKDQRLEAELVRFIDVVDGIWRTALDENVQEVKAAAAGVVDDEKIYTAVAPAMKITSNAIDAAQKTIAAWRDFSADLN